MKKNLLQPPGKTAQEERAVIAKECALIRTAFKDNALIVRHRNVAKLLFIHMLGVTRHHAQEQLFLQAILVTSGRWSVWNSSRPPAFQKNVLVSLGVYACAIYGMNRLSCTYASSRRANWSLDISDQLSQERFATRAAACAPGDSRLMQRDVIRSQYVVGLALTSVGNLATVRTLCV